MAVFGSEITHWSVICPVCRSPDYIPKAKEFHSCKDCGRVSSMANPKTHRGGSVEGEVIRAGATTPEAVAKVVWANSIANLLVKLDKVENILGDMGMRTVPTRAVFDKISKLHNDVLDVIEELNELQRQGADNGNSQSTGERPSEHNVPQHGGDS